MIGRDEVEALARLARIALTPAERDALAGELNGILEHFAVLSALEPAPGAPGRAALELRPDEPGADPLRPSLESLAPEWADGYFLVPRRAGPGSG